MVKIIEVLKYILLGLVQGVSEIMPISSSAHLLLLSMLLNINTSDLTLEVFLHFGSALAIIIFYRKRLLALLSGTYRYYIKKDRDSHQQADLFVALILATIPAAIVGFLIQDIIASLFTRLIMIGLSLLVTTFILFSSSDADEGRKTITYRQALSIGLYQTIGIIPGISRSGVTLAGARRQKIDKETAADFVFLLLIPIALGSGLLSLVDLVQTSPRFILPYFISFLVTFIATLISLNLFLHLIRHGKTRVFGYYTLVLSLITIIWSFL